MKMVILLSILVIVYVWISVSTILKVVKSASLSPAQKRLQIVLTICIPFLWPVFVGGITKVLDGSHKPHNEIPVNNTDAETSDYQ